MPYLSKIPINPMRNAGRDMLANPHLVHAMIQQGIAVQPVVERTLWRWEPTDSHQPHLLVLTGTRPDWTHITEQAGWPHADHEHFAIRDYQPLLTRLSAGRRFAFKLTANPVHNTNEAARPATTQAERTVADPRRRGQRLGHRTESHQLAWLLKRQERYGFTIPEMTLPSAEPDTEPISVPNVRVTTHDTLRFHKGRHRGGPQVTLSVATFEGVLAVADAAALHTTLLNGIGPAKAFGCALLTVAPLSEAGQA